MHYLIALDQGTSSSRSIIFDQYGQIHSSAQKEFKQHYPQPGWVEHDPMEIWQTQLSTLRQVLNQSNISATQIAALGICNQRETTIVWHRKSGLPVYNAIVWQDRRTAGYCERLREQGHAAQITEKTGLVLDPYFSATKLAWILEHVPAARSMAERGELAFGTVDSWLAWQLSEQRVHVSDVSNASRTMLWNIHNACWDEDLLNLFNIPHSLLPKVKPSSSMFGNTNLLGHPIKISGIAGDQQAALFGQACFTPGMAKNTYGTGCFILMHTGQTAVYSHNGLISSQACQLNHTPQYVLEGSVFIAGALIQWLRDGLKIISDVNQIEALASSVSDTGGVSVIPALTGLGAPYWDPDAQGAILGLTRGSHTGHIARAALEAIALQNCAVLFAMSGDAVTPIQQLRVDGGAAKNNLLMQLQADLLGIPVIRSKISETSALGAAFLAGLAVGIYQNEQECAALWQAEHCFEPKMPFSEAQERLKQWEAGVQRIRSKT